MALNIRELEYFAAVAEQRHFGRASQQVYVSQPTLSMQLKKLEEHLGAKLIERLPGGALLTPLGAEVLPIARQILQLAAEIEKRAGAKENYSRFRLGVIPTISPYLLPKINSGLSRGIKGGKVSLIEAQTAELVRSVRDGSVDVAILSTPLKERGLEETAIFYEPFYLAVNSSHPFAQRKKISLKELKSQEILLLGEGHCLRNQALSLCSHLSAGSNTDLSGTSIETLRSMVAMGDGVTLIPKMAVRKGENVVYIPFYEPSTSRTIGIIYRPSFNQKEFLNLLVEVIKTAAERDHMKLAA